MQRALGIPASGAFDAKTEAAVERFQRNEGLAVDGIVGPQTKAALGLAPAQPAADARPAVRRHRRSRPSRRSPSASRAATRRPSAAAGRYRGKYQFTRETWAAVGGTGDPAAAPEAEQDRRAAMLYAQAGPPSGRPAAARGCGSSRRRRGSPCP